MKKKWTTAKLLSNFKEMLSNFKEMLSNFKETGIFNT